MLGLRHFSLFLFIFSSSFARSIYWSGFRHFFFFSNGFVVRLLVAVATLNRGFVAQDSDRLDVEELIEMLELENPNPKPCGAFETASSPISGRWQ